ncbi:hypothetical protein [Crenothrix polyspora]|uniref:Uncharacterized protein n=1 Tax=Crenothrix polyspora TaxID=360316 RepID=A0A1R4HFV5_9GAMM|nr:hypothetical protein [Crenothrix polyspora]SJM95097.1 conserved membrane hypothetical protein [Crenothrix polyspora]
MSLLAKLGAVAIIVWFYITAKEKGENPTKWAIIGFIGYCLSAVAGYFLIFKPMAAVFLAHGTASNPLMVMLISQVPAVLALLASVLIRKRLIATVPEK